MAPQATSVECTGVLNEQDAETFDGGLAKDITPLKSAKERQFQLVWPRIIIFSFIHLSAVYGFWLIFTSAKFYTVLFAFIMYIVTAFSVTGGAHRLWAHRAYKATLPLRIFYTIINTMAYQDSVIVWARDHRVHHKYSETDADPHNATRGFFFAHMGWLLCKKHPEVLEKGRRVDLSDLEADPVLAFQKKYYKYLMPLACFILPTLAPMYFWNETFTNSFFVAAMFRWCFVMHVTWLVNSAAHIFGKRPYDVTINPSENKLVAALALGEGWHNYHHVFPWDYKAAELGDWGLNFTTFMIDLFAKLGLAYDLKTVSKEIIKSRVGRTGDGSHPTWGWGDKDQDKIELKHATVTHQLNKSD